jgi:hypothetical protein
MIPFWHLLVDLGTWAQGAESFVLALSGTVVVVLGLARLTWRAGLGPRRWRR